MLFAEVGVHVGLPDPSGKAMDAVIGKAEKLEYNGRVLNFMVNTTLRLLAQHHAYSTCRLRITLHISFHAALPSYSPSLTAKTM